MSERHFKRMRDVTLVSTTKLDILHLPEDLCLTELTVTPTGAIHARWWEVEAGKPKVVDQELAEPGSQEYRFWVNLLRGYGRRV